MGFQETFNARVMPAIERSFGVDAEFLRGSKLFELTLPYGRRESSLDRKAALGDADVTVRTRDFLIQVSQITDDGEQCYPQTSDQISWVDSASGQQSWTVFPLVSGRCYRPYDNTETRIVVYTVATEDLKPLVVTLANGREPFTVPAIPATIRAAEDYTDVRSETRVLTTTAYVARSDLADVDTPPPVAKFDFQGLAGWAIDMNRTEWGQGLVKIGLMRQTLVREWQARRNATV